MDEPSQQPAAAPAAESPLSFPVEAPRPAGLQPGAGAPTSSSTEPTTPPDPLAFPSEAAPPPSGPLVFPAEAAAPPASPLAFPAEAAPPPSDPLVFPAAATPLTDPPLFPAAAPPSDPPLFPSPPPAAQLPFPVAELPAVAVPPPAPPDSPNTAQAPVPGPAASRLPRHFPALLATLAAVLAVGGCLLPLFQMVQELSLRQGIGDPRLTITETAWSSRIEVTGQPPTDRPGVPVGIPVIVAVVLLAAAAFAAFSRPGRGLTRWFLSAGAVFTAGVVTTIGMFRFELDAIAGEEADLAVVTGPGMWLLILAAVAAAGAAALAHLPQLSRLRNPAWADPAVAYADTPTPPSGVAITVLPPDEPDEKDRPEPPLR